jgi:hypothetical protein
MRVRPRAALCLALALAGAPAWAAEDAGIERLAICHDSWLDWRNTAPELFKTYADHFRAEFLRTGNDPFFVPKTEKTIDGLRIVQAYPDSIGMGVGFSLLVDAGFDQTRQIMEGKLGTSLVKCEASDGMRTCELDMAPQRTFTLMAEDGSKSRTLVGCYYYYEK